MKKFLLAGAASFLMLGAANAADLPSVEEPAFSPVPQAAPMFTWTGFYGGANLAYGFGEFTPGGLALNDAWGFAGGLQLGYNYQINQIVVGAEADWSLANIGDSSAVVTEATINNFGTIRGRVGIAADRFMPYITGGYAFANTEVRAAGGSDTAFHNGWVVGAGVEYAWTNNITTKLEGLYADFDNVNYGGTLPPGTRAGAEVFLIRTGLNFKF